MNTQVLTEADCESILTAAKEQKEKKEKIEKREKREKRG